MMNNESLSVDKEQLKRPSLQQAHVDRLERSGLTLSAYSRMTGIGKSTLCQWRKRYGKAELASTGKFVAVNIDESPALPVTHGGLTLRIPLSNGEYGELIGDIESIVKLIKELKQWN